GGRLLSGSVRRSRVPHAAGAGVDDSPAISFVDWRFPHEPARLSAARRFLESAFGPLPFRSQAPRLPDPVGDWLRSEPRSGETLGRRGANGLAALPLPGFRAP